MKTRERRQRILAELQEKKRVNIQDLSERMEVSSMTIRRDLNRLIEMNMAVAIHGGAVFTEGGAANAAVTAREKMALREKNSIGNFCAELIKEGNAIYLDAGTTTMKIAEALLNRQNIAVLSHSLPVLDILATAKGIQLISVPGIYRPQAKGFFGEMSTRFIRGFRIDIAFIGACSADLEHGLMSNFTEDSAIKTAILETARERILVSDHSKLGRESFIKVCGLQDIHQIVTDKKADGAFVKTAKELGVKVTQV